MEIREEIKQLREQFMSQLSESQKKSFIMIFNKVKKLENEIEKSLEEFNEEDCERLLNEVLVSKTVNSLCTKLSLIKKYFRYIDNKSADKFNRDDMRKAVERYLNENDIINKYVDWNILKGKMSRLLDSDTDRAIVCLMRLGINGKEHKDIRFLKVSDIDFNNNRLIMNEKVYQFDDYMKEIFIKASNEKEVEVETANNTILRYDLNPNNPYLIKPRPGAYNNWGIDAYSYKGIIYRVLNVFERLGTTPTNMLQSVVADSIVDYEDKIGKILTRKEVELYIHFQEEKFSDYDVYRLKEYVRQYRQYGNLTHSV